MSTAKSLNLFYLVELFKSCIRKDSMQLVQRKNGNLPSSIHVFLKSLNVILPHYRCEEEKQMNVLRLGTCGATVFLIKLALRDVVVAVAPRGYLTFSILRKCRVLIG